MLVPLLFLLLSSASSGLASLAGGRPQGGAHGHVPSRHGAHGHAPSPHAACRVPSGDKTVKRFQLYPENAEFDPKRCLVYFSVLWNTSVAVWDPVENRVVGSITDARFSGRPELHASGVQLDAPRDQLSIMFNSGAAFDTSGADISGHNSLVRYDLRTKRVLWAVDLSKATHGAYGGFQDMEHDRHGNTFVCGTFPGSLMHVDVKTQAVTPWWLGPRDSRVAGISGLAMYQNRKLLATHQTGIDGSQLLWFDVNRPGKPKAIPIRRKGKPSSVGESLDAAVLPAKYGGRVLLVADSGEGTAVIHSRDGWTTAEKLGVVPSPLLGNGTSLVTPVQIGQRIFAVFEFFGDAVVRGPGQPARAGRRSNFPLQDITNDIERMLPRDLRRQH